MKRAKLKENSYIVICLKVSLFIILLLTGCTKNDNKTINIGVISSLTGTVSPYGVRAWEGIQLATDEINSSGGILGKKIKLLVEDDKSSSSDAVSAFNKLVNVNKVPVVLGPIGSSQAMACAPIANERKVVEFSPAAATPDYTNTGDYTFRNRASATLEVETMADIALKNLGMKKVAILYINNDVGTSFYPVFQKKFESDGGTIVGIESFDQGSTDIRTQLIKIKNMNPDGVYLIGHVTESGYALKQARELGLKMRFIGHLALEGPDLFKIAGNAAEGVIYTATGYDAHSTNPKVKAFEEKYRSKYNKDGDIFAATAYDAVYILKKAIEEGGYDAEGIKNALYRIKDFPGVTGSTTFDKNGDVKKPIMVKMVKDQKFVVVENIGDLK